MSLEEQILSAEAALYEAEQKERDEVNKMEVLCRLTTQSTIDAQNAHRITLEKQELLDRLQAMLEAEKEKENQPTVLVEKKKRRKGPMSAALKARRQKEYGLAWRSLNPTYKKDWKLKWEAYDKTPFKKWNTIPLPKVNPLTPAIEKRLQTIVDLRPQQSSDGSTTRRVPLETILSTEQLEEKKTNEDERLQYHLDERISRYDYLLGEHTTEEE
jgi:hypothetical protein